MIRILFPILAFSFFLSVSIPAAICDAKTRRIPNRYPLFMCGIGLLRIITGGLSIQDALIGLAWGLIPLLLLAVICHGSIGRGDMKYLSACAFTIGGLDAAIATMASLALVFGYSKIQRLRKETDGKEGVAFAPFIAIGFGIVFFIITLGVIFIGFKNQ